MCSSSVGVRMQWRRTCVATLWFHPSKLKITCGSFNSSFMVLLFYQPRCTVTCGSSIEVNAFIHWQFACGAALCASWEQCSFANRSVELRVKKMISNDYRRIITRVQKKKVTHSIMHPCLSDSNPSILCTLLSVDMQRLACERKKHCRSAWLIRWISQWTKSSDYTLHLLTNTCPNVSTIASGWADGGQLENFNISPNPNRQGPTNMSVCRYYLPISAYYRYIAVCVMFSNKCGY